MASRQSDRRDNRSPSEIQGGLRREKIRKNIYVVDVATEYTTSASGGKVVSSTDIQAGEDDSITTAKGHSEEHRGD